MGYSLECEAVVDGIRDRGTAYLESDHLLFRGATRLKLPFAGLIKIEGGGDSLTVETPEHTAVLAIGDHAARWAEKIRRPKSVVEKLGINGADTVAVLASSPQPELDAMIAESGAQRVETPAEAKCVFVFVESAGELPNVTAAASSLAAGACLWAVAPKGRKDLKDADIIRAGRDAGLVDVKVCAYSPTHTALKFTRRKRSA